MAIKLGFLGGTDWIDGEVLYSADLIDTLTSLYAAVGPSTFSELGDDFALTVSTTTISNYPFGQRYVKANGNLQSYGDVLTQNPSINSHSHSPNSTTDDGGSGGMSSNIENKTYTPKYVFLGASIVPISSGFSMPTGGILFKPTSTTHGFTALTGKYLGIGYSSDGGSSSHSHTMNEREFKNGTSTRYDGTTTSTTNEINDRQEIYAIYNTGIYTSSNDIIPIGGEILQLVSESIPSNYSEVSLSGKEGLLRFTDEESYLLTGGGSENHRHDVNESDIGYPNQGKDLADDIRTSSSNHMPPYKAVRIIKRDS